jgi:hypothetical protein
MVSDQVVALGTAQVRALATASVAALTTAQVAALETRDVAVLLTTQAAALTTGQVAALSSAQIQALTTASLAAFGTAQIAAIETADVVALTSTQIRALSTSAIAALTTSQAAALETVDIAILSTSQLVSLTTSQLAAFSTTQIGALTTGQVEALTTTQIASLSTAQVAQLALGSPIILDLDGDGTLSRSISDGVQFDVFDQGRAVTTGWVESGDGLLVLDRNGDGTISSGSELFGTATRLKDGSQAADGYAALREFDENSDGQITQSDSVWSQLRVWVDNGTLGSTDVGELRTLDSLGIASLSLQEDRTPAKDNGNLVGITSSYTTTEGETRTMADVWFVADRDEAEPTVTTALETPLAAPEGEVATSGGDGVVLPPMAVAADDAGTAGGPTLPELSLDVPTAPAEVAPSTPVGRSDPLAASDLRSRVSSLAAAIGEHAGSGDSVDDPFQRQRTPALGVTGGTLASAPAPAFTAMVDVMSRFDAQGNALTGRQLSAAPVALNTGGERSADFLSQGALGLFQRSGN